VVPYGETVGLGIYGDDFAPGIRGDAKLSTLLDRTGADSLSDLLKE